MSHFGIGKFPSQRLSFNKKNKKWRKSCVDFGDDHSLLHYHLSRKSVENMSINYDLLNGKIHLSDFKLLLNPYDLDASFIPDNIQHYPAMNSKLEVLHGEESKRVFDYRVVITNPTAISEMEEEKNAEVNRRLQQLLMDTSQTEEQYYEELEKLSDYFTYEYQDKREVRANRVLNHYIKELEIQQQFNKGFKDAYTVGEEAYLCDIVGGEPYLEKIDPRKMRVLKSGYSTNIEDADMIVLEDYWSPGRVIDTYWDQLSKKDIEALENAPDNSNNKYVDGMDNLDARYGFVLTPNHDWVAGDSYIGNSLFDDDLGSSLLPYDMNGNVRVLRVFWKSMRKIKKVKSYDPETGEEQFNFYPETYYCDPDKGEEEESFWINEAWEGTKIGADIYVNMRPRPIQYNRLSNPSRCHFGIIGSVYSTNGDQPFSLVDIMKPYAYLYDVIHDRLNKVLAKNVGKVIRLDMAKVPTGWPVDKWLYYLTVNGIAVENSYNEGQVGRSTGVLAGSMNNATSGVIDASLGTEIQQYISLLEWISNKMGEQAGISKQREGQISNRETVGGVERATLQSSHSTEWLFITHDSVKKRVLECLLETAKIAFKGRKVKFEYILSDGSKQLMELDGDEFAECDYGLVVDNSNGTQELNQKLDMLAQAGLQNGMEFSTIMKLYTESSMAAKQRTIEISERKRLEQAQKEQEQQQQQFQMQLQQQAQIEQMKSDREYQMHAEDNETKLLVAQINSRAEAQRFAMMNHDNDEANTIEREKMAETARQFDAKLRQDDKKLELEKQKQKDDVRIKEKQITAKKG